VAVVAYLLTEKVNDSPFLCMFGRKIEPSFQKEWSHSVFSPLHSEGVSAGQLGHLPKGAVFVRQAQAACCGCAIRLRHGFSPESSSSRHIFLKNAASANRILRFDLSHKFSSNLFQNSADSIDKKGRASYVLEHRMRIACALFRSPLTHPF
jgi:hypothetical protein